MGGWQCIEFEDLLDLTQVNPQFIPAALKVTQRHHTVTRLQKIVEHLQMPQTAQHVHLPDEAEVAVRVMVPYASGVCFPRLISFTTCIRL